MLMEWIHLDDVIGFIAWIFHWIVDFFGFLNILIFFVFLKYFDFILF